MIFIAIVIGFLISAFGVYAVVVVYKYKGTSKATMVRIIGGASVAITVAFGQYLLQYVFGDGTDLSLDVSIAFTTSIIITLIVVFWVNRKKIG